VHFVEGKGPQLDAVRSAAELARLNPRFACEPLAVWPAVGPAGALP
jgi:hypothetical protein